MFKRWLLALGIGICVVLGACSATEEDTLPTRVILADEIAPENFVAVITESPSETPVQSGARPLPPTFTPIPTATPEPTRTPRPTEPPRIGKILFIYNDDAIISINDDGSAQELIITFGVERRISELRLSPKGDIIAFIAPGSGSAREVWIANATGTYLQQVSCLGFADVRHLTWSADGQALAFVAGQSIGSPLNIYTVGWQGANNCPTGNNQRLVVECNSQNLAGLAFSADGGILFFSDRQIYAINLTDFTISPPLSSDIGFGNDFALAYSPTANILAYIQNTGRVINNRDGGNLIGLNVATLDTVTTAFTERSRIEKFVWRADGNAILQSASNGVFIYRLDGGIGVTINNNTSRFPNAIFSPDGTQVAYIDGVNNIPQIFIVSATGGTSTRQLTALVEGQIGDVIWMNP